MQLDSDLLQNSDEQSEEDHDHGEFELKRTQLHRIKRTRLFNEPIPDLPCELALEERKLDEEIYFESPEKNHKMKQQESIFFGTELIEIEYNESGGETRDI